MAKPKPSANGYFVVTDEGMALLAFIEAGLAPKDQESYDIDGFETFWRSYMKMKTEQERSIKELANQRADNRKRNFKKHALSFLRCLLVVVFGFLIGRLFRSFIG